ncbi:MAG: hypothetical protein LKM39_03705 [Chiayiivirga sp.]|nr:hypothetical protein [Chiayiivirga sp.]
MSSLIQQFRQSSQLAGGSAAYIEDLYEAWLADPAAVSPAWRTYFDGFKGREAGDVPHSQVMQRVALAARLHGEIAPLPVGEDHAQGQGGVRKLVTAYRSRGHLRADLDPLGMATKAEAPDLDLAFHGLDSDDLGTEFSTQTFFGPDRMQLKDLLGRLRATYCGHIGAEFMHIADADQRHRLTAAEGLERYLHTKYVGQKRFSLEGGDSLIPLMDELVSAPALAGVKEIVIGMAHRGRLNVLVNTLGKMPQEPVSPSSKASTTPEDLRAGDVKYHRASAPTSPRPAARCT